MPTFRRASLRRDLAGAAGAGVATAILLAAAALAAALPTIRPWPRATALALVVLGILGAWLAWHVVRERPSRYDGEIASLLPFDGVPVERDDLRRVALDRFPSLEGLVDQRIDGLLARGAIARWPARGGRELLRALLTDDEEVRRAIFRYRDEVVPRLMRDIDYVARYGDQAKYLDRRFSPAGLDRTRELITDGRMFALVETVEGVLAQEQASQALVRLLLRDFNASPT